MRLKLIIILTVLLAGACRPTPPAQTFLVSLVADDSKRTFEFVESMTVEEFLQHEKVQVEVGAEDRLTPPRFTQLSDGMQITIVRVKTEQECEEEIVPFEQQRLLNEGMKPGEERLAQVGENGTQRVCYRITYNDGLPGERVQVGQPIILKDPVDEIVYVGLETNPEPVPVTGTLAYINNNNAWVIRGSSTTKKPLTTTSNLDGLVINLSPDGNYLLYTADPVDEESFINELWLVATSGSLDPVKLVPTDVLYAEWMPGQTDTLSYSTGEIQDIFPFWDALNNVLLVRIDPNTGQSIDIDEIVPESLGGLSGWWGTVYKWSPDGQTLGYVRADSAGIIGEEGEFVPLVEYAPNQLVRNWSWRADLSWSWDGELIATAAHGAPLGGEQAERSSVFNAVVADKSATFEATVVDNAGIWVAPQFSPKLQRPDSEYEYGFLAYLRARDPHNSLNGEYDLVVADRDGSNAKVIFPAQGQPGIISQSRISSLMARDFAWSPDGRQIAVIYQGNVWIVGVETGISHRLTFDGQSKYPVWSN